MKKAALTILWAAAAGLCATATAGEVKRTVDPGGRLPIATAVTVPANASLVYFSGAVPSVSNPAAAPGTIEAYGADTEAHALAVLAKLETALKAEGLTFGDVISVRAFLVGDPKLEGRMDFAGFNKAFRTRFATPEQPNAPARAVVQVVALPAPGALVEIELTAMRPSTKAKP